MKFVLFGLILFSLSSRGETCLDGLNVGGSAVVGTADGLVSSLGEIYRLGPGCTVTYWFGVKPVVFGQTEASQLLRHVPCDSAKRVCAGQTVVIGTELIKIDWVLSNDAVGYRKCSWGYCRPLWYRLDQVIPLNRKP